MRRIVEDSPALKAGVKDRDIVLEIDGTMVPADGTDFLKFMAKLKNDSPLAVVVFRQGDRLNVGNITLPAKFPDPAGKPTENGAGNVKIDNAAKPSPEPAADYNDDVAWSVAPNGDTEVFGHAAGTPTISIKGIVINDKVHMVAIVVNDEGKTQSYDIRDRSVVITTMDANGVNRLPPKK